VSGKVTELPHPSRRSLEPALSAVGAWGTRGVLSRVTRPTAQKSAFATLRSGTRPYHFLVRYLSLTNANR
jgi:hypothetical protein